MARNRGIVLVGCVAVALAVCAASKKADASWWTRTSGLSCIGESAAFGNTNAAGAWGLEALHERGNSSFADLFQLNHGWIALCPFEQRSITENGVTTEMFDTDIVSVSSVKIDLVNQNSETFPAGALSAQMCVFTNFTYTCGGASTNPSIPANSHTFGWGPTDHTAWTNDSGHGYATIMLWNIEASNPSINVGGIYLST